MERDEKVDKLDEIVFENLIEIPLMRQKRTEAIFLVVSDPDP